MFRPSLAVLLAVLGAAPAAAQASGTPAHCSAPEYRQFDFWVGDWDVMLPSGTRAGHNRVESVLGGCVLRETWAGAGGLAGTSYNIYDHTRKVWHQTWVDGQGNLLQLEGAFAGGRMVLEGETVDSSGGRARQRITWERNASGQVRQLWETSADGGTTWSVAFDGLYRKR